MKRWPLLWFAFVLGSLALFSSASLGAAPVTPRDLDDFISHYYLKPAPEKVADYIRALGTTGLAGQKNVRPPYLGFLSEVFSANPARLAEWQRAAAEDPATQTLYHEALQLSHAGGVRAITAQTPATNDECWGAFYATGSSDFLRKLIGQLPAYDERDNRELFLTGATARWSLASNSHSDPLVRSTLELAKATAGARLRLLIDEVLTHDPAELKADIRKIVLEQRKRGKWL